jgi:hypothetical protein
MIPAPLLSFIVTDSLPAKVQTVSTSAAGTRLFHRMSGVFADAVLLLLAVFLLPLIILLAGSPIALFVRLLIEVAHRL